MATVKWAGSPTSRGTVLTTELNALATAGFSAAGPAYDNTTNLDRWGWVEFSGGSLTPTSGAVVMVYVVTSPGGTNYDDGASSTNPGTHELVCVLSLRASVGAVRAITTFPFALPPSNMKFILKNQAGVSLAATGNTLTLYTSNESVA